MSSRYMKDKQKVTLYIPQDLHHKLKIRAALDSEPMSAIAERAIRFYLTHPEVVDSLESSYGRSHQVHVCPECHTNLVIRDGELEPISESLGIISDAPPESFDAKPPTLEGESESEQLDRINLVPC